MPRSWLWPIGLLLAVVQVAGAFALINALDQAATTAGARRAIVVGAAALPIITLLAVAVIDLRLWSAKRRLAAAAREVAHGERGAARDMRGGELADVADAFNQMIGRLQERIGLLQAQISQQRIIHESMSTGIMALNLKQHILSINRAAQRVLGVEEEVAKNRFLRDVVQQPELNRLISQASITDKPASAEFELVGADETMVHVTAEPLRNAENTRVGLLLLINDVTRLRRLESIRSDFAANVSHELRTPITNIQGYVETLLDGGGLTDQSQATAFLEIIKRNTERLGSIIEDLLALARLEQPDARGTLRRAATTLRPVLEAAAADLDEARAARQLTIEIEADAALSALVNTQLIQQAVVNLLSNAIKYSPPQSTITIRAVALASDEVEIAVIDQGAGIAAEHLPRLFERFYRVDRARSRELGGTGLGLAIVKHIAQVHGGRAEVESELGKGSEFRIIVPAR